VAARKPDVLYAMGLSIHPLTGRFVPRLDWYPGVQTARARKGWRGFPWPVLSMWPRGAMGFYRAGLSLWSG
jgi:hypothetical protein